MGSYRPHRWRAWIIETASAVFLVWLLYAVVAGLGSTFFTLRGSAEPSSVAALTHDGSSQHHLSVYLCVDASSDIVQATVVIDRSIRELNMRLPSLPDLTTSLGFLDAANTVAPLLKAPPGCLADPRVRELAVRTVAPAVEFVGQSDVVSLFDKAAPALESHPLPADVISGVRGGFPVVLAPSATNSPTPVSFNWRGVYSRSYTQRFLRLEFPGPIGTPLGIYEMPTDVWVFLPRNLTPVNPPTSAVIATGIGGNTVFHMPVSAQNPAVEVDWQVDQAAQTRDFTLLGTGILVGVIGGMIAGFAFGRPRWVDALDRLISWGVDRYRHNGAPVRV
jgi:hypothetical protein